MPNKKLFAYRTFAGIGDWIMALTVLKMVNQQYPNVDIYLNTLAKNLHISRSTWFELPDLTKEIINNCDVKIKELVRHTDIKKASERYDYVSGHMRYSKDEAKLFIETIVDRFNKNTGLELKYDPSVCVKWPKLKETLSLIAENYLLMQSSTKRRHKNPRWKDYGFKNMQEIYDNLKKKFVLCRSALWGT